MDTTTLHAPPNITFEPAALLTRALTANAVFSLISAIALVVGAVPLGRWLDIPALSSVTLGVGLGIFALAVARVARRPRPGPVRAIIAADATWVLGAAIVIVGFPWALSTAGLWLLGVVSLAVTDFAVVQAIGLRRSDPTA